MKKYEAFQDWNCPKCHTIGKPEIKKKGPHKSAYCTNCGAFIGHTSKKFYKEVEPEPVKPEGDTITLRNIDFKLDVIISYLEGKKGLK